MFWVPAGQMVEWVLSQSAVSDGPRGELLHRVQVVVDRPDTQAGGPAVEKGESRGPRSRTAVLYVWLIAALGCLGVGYFAVELMTKAGDPSKGPVVEVR